MTKIKIIKTLIIFLCLFSTSYGISLKIINEDSYSVEQTDIFYDYDQIKVLILDNDTIISTSGAGVWGKFAQNQPWQKLLDCASDKDWKDDYFYNKKWENKISSPPEKIWRDIVTDEIVLHIPSVNDIKLRILHLQEDDSYVEESKNNLYTIKDSYANFNYNKNYLISGLYSYKDEMPLMKIHKIKNGQLVNSKKLFTLPTKLRENLNLVGLSNPPSIAVLNPDKLSIWVATWGLKYVYEIDTNGILLDSIEISQSDYITPQPPISRLRTQAVWRDWLSKWTPVKSLYYVKSGYFILQYRTSFEIVENDTIPLYSTMVWDDNNQTVKLEIDTHWQIAGVQPDGKIIFAHYFIEGENKQVVINITRIVP